jgi:hypothetical protein
MPEPGAMLAGGCRLGIYWRPLFLLSLQDLDERINPGLDLAF